MAGRGRGRGRGGLSFNVEQLGFSKGDNLPGPVLQPPPLYPPLQNRPLPLESSPEMDYLLMVRKEFQEYIYDSPFYVRQNPVRNDIERYSDRYQAALAGPKTNQLEVNWSRFPEELRHNVSSKRGKRKTTSSGGKTKEGVKKKLKVDLKKLDDLEKIEGKDAGSDAEDSNMVNKEDDDDEEGGNKEEGDEDEEDLDPDKEMDEDTDYMNAHFDNGEDYLEEEDDNLDEGAVY